MSSDDTILENFTEHLQIIELAQSALLKPLKDISKLLVQTLINQGTIFWAGNGGSASDSQHLAAELVGRFRNNRRALRSISLNTDTSILTCVANDFGFDKIFSRQIEALARPGDVFIGISTSGNSPNIARAIETSKSLGLTTVGLFGNGGGSALSLVDNAIVIPSSSTARVQEAHILIGHILCDLIEEELLVD